MAGVGIVIEATSAFALTDGNGRFEFKGVAAGTHTLVFTLLDNSVTRPDVEVTAGTTTTVDQEVDWQVAYAETVTVRGVSRRRERIVDAPAAVTTISEKEMGREASHGLTPKLFEFTPGVDITQINLSEFLVNTRGFNSALNRRVPLLIDGRDLTDPFIGATEWSVLSFPIDDFSELDLVRGPTSVLYGANATSGIINITTKQPRYSQGGMVRLTAGELNSANAELRWAGGIGREWYVKIVGGRRISDGYSESRTDSTEYSVFCEPPLITTDCLPRENMPLPRDEVDIVFGGLRVDKYLPNGNVFTIEGGTTEYDGTVFISAPGRGQFTDASRPWARFNFTSEHWNVFAYYSGRDVEAVNLVTTNQFLLDAEQFRIEFQTNRSFAGNKVQLVAGGSYYEETIDSSALEEKADTDEQALFAQIDWNVNDHLKLVGGLRWDDSTLYDSQVSPKASVLYSVNPRHTLRFTYNEGFQVPTYAEYLLYLQLASLDLSSLNQTCLDYAGVDCGLGGGTPSLLIGNESLDLEQVQTFELGYKGILGSKAVFSIDLYESENENFVTTFLPQLHPILGPVNENFGDWVGPVEAETTQIAPANCSVAIPPGMTVADCVRAEAAAALGLSQLTNRDDESIVVALSLTTFGRVDTQGADVGFGYFFNDDWRLSFSYSWFDFDIQEGSPGLETVLLPNAPENKASLGLFYAKGRWDAGIRGRWVDDFRWANSTYQGDVESFTTVDLTGNYAVNKNWRVGLNVANLFDEDHWEAFGGDLLGRRALANVTFAW
jgi:iron complex outermembrane receptor protein